MRRRQRERIESLKEEEEECKGQVLNGERIVFARLQLCGRVGETEFLAFQFFYCVQVSPRCVEMKIIIFSSFYLLR